MNTLRTYITGYVLSLVLTLSAFGLMELHIYMHHRFPSHETLAVAFIALALVQFAVQVYCFLHLGKGSDKVWNITAFSFALIVVVILVGGTLWIMNNLQANMTPPFDSGQITPQAEQD